MVGEYLASPNLAAGTYISSCNSSSTIGTPCTSGSITLSADPTVSGSTTITVATAPLNIGTNTFIDGTKGVRFDGITPNEGFWYYLATGDFNGDGIPDLIIGAPGTSYGGNYAGSTYVVFGKTTSTAMLASMTTTTSTSSTSITPAPYSGLMVGEYLASSNLAAGTYIASCNSSSTVGTPCTSGSITLSADPTVSGSTTITVATAPLSIGTNTFIDGTKGVRFDGPSGYIYSGDNVATGDVNGDGIHDLIMGTAGSGYFYVVFGKSATWGTAGNVVLNTGSGNVIDGTQGFQLVSAGASSYSIATGDINGDGIPDIVLGFPSSNTDAGCVYTYFGHKTSPTQPWPNPSYTIASADCSSPPP
jgi:hypothetical protein